MHILIFFNIVAHRFHLVEDLRNLPRVIRVEVGMWNLLIDATHAIYFLTTTDFLSLRS